MVVLVESRVKQVEHLLLPEILHQLVVYCNPLTRVFIHGLPHRGEALLKRHQQYHWLWARKCKCLFKKDIYKWKMGPSNISFLSFRVIFHFHDYGRKGASSTLHFHHSSEFRGVETRWWFLTEVKSWKELRSELLAFLDGWQVRGHFIG